MSVDKYTYFGPYISYEPKVNDSTEYRRICSDLNGKNCKNSTKKLDSEFCPKCGSAVVSKPFPSKSTTDAHDVLGDEIYSLFQLPHAGGMPLEESILIPNDIDGRPFKLDLDDESICGSIPLPSAQDIELDKAWMVEKYGEYIEKLREHFEVELGYGFVIHYN